MGYRFASGYIPVEVHGEMDKVSRFLRENSDPKSRSGPCETEFRSQLCNVMFKPYQLGYWTM